MWPMARQLTGSTPTISTFYNAGQRTRLCVLAALVIPILKTLLRRWFVIGALVLQLPDPNDEKEPCKKTAVIRS